MYYGYILKDKSSGRLYIGSTNNLRRRLEDHRRKAVFSTERFSNFTLVYPVRKPCHLWRG
ncbi:MAG: GIY-YIG nuclease family protein [Deltaproteobacteria bacterium]|nr:GIY-YIG nuclease family protein [Deltaproteobacteria bacterium]